MKGLRWAMTRALSRWWLAVVLVTPALAQAAGIGVATLLDGEATLLRGAEKLTLAEGVRLAASDIVETAAGTRLVRLELDEGLLVDLGPATRLQLVPRLSGEPARRAVRTYLLQGWVKLSATQPLPERLVLACAALDLAAPRHSSVLALDAGDVFVFAESGEQAGVERSGGRAGAALALKTGEFYARHGDAKAETGSRPSPVFLQRVPKAFLDTLPPRAAQFARDEVVPKPLGTLAYADVQPWIDAEQALRSGFVARWRALARQPAFRQSLQDGMAAHPEWDPLLNPEKYLPQPASGVAPGGVSAASRPTVYPNPR